MRSSLTGSDVVSALIRLFCMQCPSLTLFLFLNVPTLMHVVRYCCCHRAIVLQASRLPKSESEITDTDVQEFVVDSASSSVGSLLALAPILIALILCNTVTLLTLVPSLSRVTSSRNS